MTDAPWRRGQPEQLHAVDTPTAPLPVWLHDAAEPVAPVPPRPRRVAVVVLAVLLGVVLTASGTLTWYLLRVNAAWQQHSQQWEALAEQHGADLAQARSDLEQTRTELAGVQEQLTTAQGRITQLADEKAQLGDQTAAQQQLADYQARVSKAAGQVATALANCIDGQQQLIGYLADPSKYAPDQLAAYQQQVQDYCRQARDANTALQSELAK